MSGKTYPKPEYVVRRANAVLQPGRKRDKVVEVPREKPCNIIVVHGVNDVGTSYNAVEEGLCAGLQDRLFRQFKPGTYRMPGADDKTKVLDDPDLVFFKRGVATDTDSPVIPFYWGYREVGTASKTVNGQKTDRNGNRLDKDLSKGGGPFGNATSSLPDMWNRGVYAPIDPAGDPLRPVKTGPGRMYMVLAARRLAALISMIRQYEPNDTVNVVAHSQGCLLSLLAQALLLEMGERTADTVILTHPPYSLDEKMGMAMRAATFFQGDKDKAMDGFYNLIAGMQSVNARLQTLVNIVAGIAKSKATAPVFSRISETDSSGMVHGRWKPDADRDNRGKVYLYFSPEDMTVALDNMRGIGWQGVPDTVEYMRQAPSPMIDVLSDEAKFGPKPPMVNISRKALNELGIAFRQRVFTAKIRPATGTGKAAPVLVGQPPHDFVLRVEGEDDHAHVAASGRTLRESLPETPRYGKQRHGIRTINGEALKTPCHADIRGNQIDADKIPAPSMIARVDREDRGPCEEVDPIDAAIALTSGSGLQVKTEGLPASVAASIQGGTTGDVSEEDRRRLETAYNKVRLPDSTNSDDMVRIVSAKRFKNGAVTAQVQESPNAARLRWQQEFSPKSFHSVIFASRKNHQQVTAYDLSIGSGKAASDPRFLAYLCAVADWRLKMPDKKIQSRPGILTWDAFLQLYGAYYESEPAWRKQLIRGNADYYSLGTLPTTLPLLTGKLWDIVISETTSGKQVSASMSKGKS
jgi:pimeloyl-ACP methyl ester carboxylesterase